MELQLDTVIDSALNGLGVFVNVIRDTIIQFAPDHVSTIYLALSVLVGFLVAKKTEGLTMVFTGIVISILTLLIFKYVGL